MEGFTERKTDWDCYLIFSNVHSIQKHNLIFVFSRYMLICFISLRPLNLLQQHYYLLFTIESHKATAGNHHDEAESGHQYNWCGLLIPRFRCKQNSGSQRLVHRLPAVIQCVIFMRHRVFCQMHHTYCNGKIYFKVYFGPIDGNCSFSSRSSAIKNLESSQCAARSMQIKV